MLGIGCLVDLGEGDKIAGTKNFPSMALPLPRPHSCSLQLWLKETYKSMVNLFKTLIFTQKVIGVLFWPRLIHHPLVEEIVKTDTPTEGYGDHIKSLSLKSIYTNRRSGNPMSIS